MIGESNNMNTYVPANSEADAIDLQHSEISQDLLLPHNWIPAHNDVWQSYQNISHQQMKQDECSSVKIEEEQNDLYRTRQSEQQLELLQDCNRFEYLNEEHMEHFKYPQEGEKRNKRKCRFGKGSRAISRAQNQNLRGIAKHIKNIITKNPNLTVKNISYILFEINTCTPLGIQIVEDNYPILGSQILEILAEKYRYEQCTDSQLSYIVKNTRRRLYDAINVLIASSVIYKSKTSNVLKLIHQQKLQERKRFVNKRAIEMNQKEAFHDLVERTSQTMNRIEVKRKLLTALQNKKMIADRLIARNSMEDEENETNQKRFHLPVTVILCQSKMLMEVSSSTVRIISPSNFEILDDMECLQKILQVHTKRFSFLKPKVRN